MALYSLPTQRTLDELRRVMRECVDANPHLFAARPSKTTASTSGQNVPPRIVLRLPPPETQSIMADILTRYANGDVSSASPRLFSRGLRSSRSTTSTPENICSRVYRNSSEMRRCGGTATVSTIGQPGTTLYGPFAHIICRYATEANYSEKYNIATKAKMNPTGSTPFKS